MSCRLESVDPVLRSPRLLFPPLYLYEGRERGGCEGSDFSRTKSCPFLKIETYCELKTTDVVRTVNVINLLRRETELSWGRTNYDRL